MALRKLSGTEVLGPFVVPDSGVNEQARVEISVPRMTTLTPLIFSDPLCVMTVRVEASFDNELTWVPAGGFTAFGGVHRTMNGLESATSGMSIPYPDQKNRRLRLTVSVSLPTRGDVTMTIKQVSKRRVDGITDLR